ncbi:MAG: SDR family oxidoreductase [Planctomycetota bacterium]
MFRPDLLRGQVIVVTGGGTGIGRTIAHELASLGAHVVLAARREEKLAATAAEIAAAGGEASCVATNVRDEQAVEGLFRRVVEERGALHGLVNNAGGQFVSPAEHITLKGWNAVIETNLTGIFLCCREAHRAWFGEHGGAIVNIVSEMWRGFPGMAHSGAARAAVDNLTKTLAIEWATAGVRVNAVAPGLIESSGLETYPEMVRGFLEEIRQDIPFQRMGTEAEVAGAVTFLLSPAAAYVSGETLRVDGAASLWRKTWTIPAHDRFPRYTGWEE